MKVVVFKAKGRQPWRFRLVSGNNKVMSQSEGYLTKWNVRRAVRRAFPNLPVEHE